MTQVVIATHNAHKVDELRRILGDALDGVELLAYDGPEPVEDGDTFEANALIKARAAAEHTGLPAIADDSGIAVDALGGAPGIHSARYAGTRDDGDNLRLLLVNLGDEVDRRAQFVCAAALVVPPSLAAVGPDGPADSESAVADEFVELAEWHGTVLTEPAGEGGFGYDPIFRPAESEVSAAGLTREQKDTSSHRSQAFRALAPRIAALRV